MEGTSDTWKVSQIHLVCQKSVNCGALFHLRPCRLVGRRRFGLGWGGGGGGGCRQWLNIVCELTCGSGGSPVSGRGGKL